MSYTIVQQGETVAPALTTAQITDPTNTVQGTVSGQLLAQLLATIPVLTPAQAESSTSTVEGLISGSTLSQVVGSGSGGSSSPAGTADFSKPSNSGLIGAVI